MISNISAGCGPETNHSHPEGNQNCSDQPFKHYYEYKEFEVYRFLAYNSLFVHTIPAIPLNLLCVIAVALVRPFNSSCVFMLVLVCADLVCVICRVVFIYTDIASSELFCKSVRYTLVVSTVYSNFVLVCFTMERTIVTSVPLKTAQICTIRNAIISLTLSLILCLALNMPYLLGATILYRDVNGVRSVVCRLTDFVGNKWVKVYGAYHNIVPLILVVVGNLVIVCNIKKAHKRRMRLTNRASADDQQSPTRTLLVLSMVFAILHLPYALFSLFVPDYPMPVEIPFWDQHMLARLLLTGHIFYQLVSSQNAVNFFLFYLTASNFRRALYQMILALKKHVTRPLWLKLTWCSSRCRKNSNKQTFGTTGAIHVISVSSVDTARNVHEYFQP